MFSLIKFLPWYFWFFGGIIGAIYLLRWVLKSSQDDPALLRIAWGMIALLGTYMAIDSYIEGMGLHIEYWGMIEKLAMIIFTLMMTLMVIGGYQKVMRSGYDPAKRRLALIGMFAMGGGLIIMSLAFIIVRFSN